MVQVIIENCLKPTCWTAYASLSIHASLLPLGKRVDLRNRKQNFPTEINRGWQTARVSEKNKLGCSYMRGCIQISLTTYKSSACSEGLKLQGLQSDISADTISYKASHKCHQRPMRLRSARARAAPRPSLLSCSLDGLQSTALPSLRQGLFLFFTTFSSKWRNYTCCHPLTGTPACSHGKC